MKQDRAAYVLVAVSVALGVAGQLLLRLGASSLHAPGTAALLRAAALSPAVVGGLAAYAVSSALWLAVLSRIDVSKAYPMGASSHVLVVALAALAGEAVPPQRWGGAALIMVGVTLVGSGHVAEEDLVEAAEEGRL